MPASILRSSDAGVARSEEEMVYAAVKRFGDAFYESISAPLSYNAALRSVDMRGVEGVVDDPVEECDVAGAGK